MDDVQAQWLGKILGWYELVQEDFGRGLEELGEFLIGYKRVVLCRSHGKVCHYRVRMGLAFGLAALG